MRLAFLFHFLTLVVLTAQAAPDVALKPKQISTSEMQESSGNNSDLQTMQISPAPPVRRLEQRQAKVSDSSTSYGIGVLNGALNKDKASHTVGTFQVQRTQYNLNETAQEFGLTLTANGLFGLDWGFKKECCHLSFAQSWRPFYKFGIYGSYDPEDMLGNFIDYKRYLLQLSTGFESLGTLPDWRFEAGIRGGWMGTQVYSQILYAFPD